MYRYSFNTFNKSILLCFIFYLFSKHKNQAVGSDIDITSTTQPSSNTVELTTINAIQDLSTPFSTTATRIQSTTTESTNAIKNIVKNIIPYDPSIKIPLADENLILKISAREKTLEFTITVKKVPLENSHKDTSFSNAQRLLIAFENDYFNIDVVSLPFINDTKGQIAFGNNIEDFVWNKRNGILLLDAVQNYKWIASGAQKNGTQFFITFQRSWMTCDEQDIQFLLSMFKVWWLIDTKNGNKSVSKEEKIRALNRNDQMFEKQTAITDSPKAEDVTENGNSAEHRTIDGPSISVPPVITTTQSTTPLTELSTSPVINVTSSIPSVTKDKNGSKSLGGMDFANKDEVEVLKSIEEHNFNGPVNTSLLNLANNISFIYIKGCEASATIFRCSASDIKTFEKLNITKILHIWRVHISSNSLNSTEKLSEYQIESCKFAVEDPRKIAGNRMPKSHSLSKNKGIARMGNQNRVFEVLSVTVIISLITFFYILPI